MISQQRDDQVADRALFRSWPIGTDTWMRFGAAYVVLVLLGLGLGGLVTGPLASTGLGRFDTDVLLWLETHRIPALDVVSRVADSFADTIHVVAAVIALAVGFAWVWRRWRESLVLVFGMSLEALVFLTVSLTVGRDRPPVEQLDVSPPTASFPSGHTGAAFTLYGTLALIVLWNTRRPVLRFLAVATAIIIPVSVAVARVYRGMHYLSDVVVGAGLGIACIAVTVLLVDRAIESRLEGAP